MKVDVEHFGCNNFIQNFRFMKSVVKCRNTKEKSLIEKEIK